jgi:rSAM/selenodomain-associated transferase 1
MGSGLLLVMAKVPKAGQVKTRLARTVGDGAALRLAEAFLADTWQTARRVPNATAVLVLSGAGGPQPSGAQPPDQGGVAAALAAAPGTVWDQGEGDLGQRLERALCRALATHGWAMAIGTDSPDLPEVWLSDAAETLERHASASEPHAVLGPTVDGGYFLIGLTACPPGLLEHLPWSREVTFEATRNRLTSFGFHVTLLPEWYDVDEATDLKRLEASLLADPERAPRTRAVLSTGGPVS